MKKALALDFDGVICDSAGEMAVAAWKSGRTYWPEWNTPEPPADLIRKFRSLRPVVVTGYQALALLRLLFCHHSERQILTDFARLEENLFLALGETRENLIRQFGSARDSWIKSDPADWLKKNSFYPGVPEALINAQVHGHLLYILSTKQIRFTTRLLKHAGIEIPENHIYGLESGRSKADILLSLMNGNQPCEWYFIEDRPEALEKAFAKAELANVQLFLAEWGYNLPEEVQRIRQHSTIRSIVLPQFLELCLS